MSMMLIDQTKDSACKTAEADAIRAKTGGSAQIAYDWENNKGFADAIDAIPTGGGAQSITFLDWENKAVTSATGGISANSQRIMCAHLLRKFSSMVIPTGYDYAIFANKNLTYSNLYSFAATYLGSWTGTTWAKSLTWRVADGTPVDFTSLADWEDCFLLIVIRNSGSDTAIDPSVGSNVMFTYNPSNGSYYL